jgi:hypothetical protein
MEFNAGLFPSAGGGAPTCNTCNFKRLEVGPANGPSVLVCDMTTQQNSMVSIDAGGGNKDITIKRNSGSNGVEISFDRAEYPAVGQSQGHSNNNKIKVIKFTPKLSCTYEGVSDPQVPPGPACSVIADCQIKVAVEH